MSDATQSPWVFSFENIDPEGSVITMAGAADQALSVAHLWDMPDIVREYLTTLDESKRVDAAEAARAADGSTTRAERYSFRRKGHDKHE